MRASTIILIAAGFGLRAVSKSLELQGDIAAAPTDRLFYHGLALFLLIGAGFCFLRGLRLAVRALTGRAKSPHAEIARVFADDDQPVGFDPDGALERYRARKQI